MKTIQTILQEFKDKADKLLFVHEIKCASWDHETCDCKDGYPLDLLTKLAKNALIQSQKEVREAAEEVDHSIDVRYEDNVLVAFDKFIKKWCGNHYSHLIDNDENDGEFMREKIEALLKENK